MRWEKQKVAAPQPCPVRSRPAHSPRGSHVELARSQETCQQGQAAAARPRAPHSALPSALSAASQWIKSQNRCFHGAYVRRDIGSKQGNQCVRSYQVKISILKIIKQGKVVGGDSSTNVWGGQERNPCKADTRITRRSLEDICRKNFPGRTAEQQVQRSCGTGC